MSEDPKPTPYEKEQVDPSGIESNLGFSPVTPDDRQGVFIHSFICNDCNLHFNVYSWKAMRHRAKNVTCPECGQSEGRFRHFWKVESENEQMADDGKEIFNRCPVPGASLMDDSRIP